MRRSPLLSLLIVALIPTIAHAQSCSYVNTVSLGPSHIHQVGPGQSSDYNGRPIRGELHCPPGYLATGIGYKGSNMKHPQGQGSFDPLNGGVGNLLKADSTADITIGCMKLESNGTLTNWTGWLNNPNLNANPRFFSVDNCAPGSIMKSIAQKDLDASVGNSDELDGVMAHCQYLSVNGFGAGLQVNYSADIFSNPRLLAYATCTGNDVVTGIIYDQMDGSSNTDIDSVRPFCAPVIFSQTVSSCQQASSVASSVASSIPASSVASSVVSSSVASSVASLIASSVPSSVASSVASSIASSSVASSAPASSLASSIASSVVSSASSQSSAVQSSIASSIAASSAASSIASSASSQSSTASSIVSSSVASSIASSVSSALPQCRDGLDNDGDGVADYPSDFSCSGPDDNDETNPKAQCQDGADNDGDGSIDFPQDPGCSSRQDNDEYNQTTSSSYQYQCQDGRDNDGDGYADYPSDPGCFDRYDDNENNPVNPYQPQCGDGRDNDGDGLVDYPADTGCNDRNDNDEDDGFKPGGNVTVQKNADRGEAQPGDMVSYTVTVRNDSNREVDGVIVEDSLDNAAGVVVVDAGGAQVNGNVLKWTVGRLEQGQNRSFTYRVRLGTHLRHGDIVVNRVRISSGAGSADSSATIRIIERLPQTGFFDGKTPFLSRVKKNYETGSGSGWGAGMTLSSILMVVAAWIGRRTIVY